MDSLELAARYSFMPNKLKYCGPEDADKVLFDYVLNKKNKSRVKFLLDKFEAFSIYLALIAEKNNKHKFDLDVIEAYWIGNKLLDTIKKEDIKKMILSDFTKKGLPVSVAKKLAQKLPDEATPHHSFHVMHIHSITGKLKFMFSNIDKCRISWGKISKIMPTNLIIEYAPIIVSEKIVVGNHIQKEIKYDKKFLGTVKKGDIVAVHWDYAVHRLTQSQKENLEKYTLRNINAINAL